MARPLNWGCSHFPCSTCDDRWKRYGYLHLNITDKEKEMPVTASEPKFWLVWNMSSRTGFSTIPTKPHTNAMDAGREASRLAKKNPGQEFTVVEALQTYQVEIPEVTIIRHV